MAEFEIYFHDLNEASQAELIETLGTTPEEENWDVFPLAVIQREKEGQDD